MAGVTARRQRVPGRRERGRFPACSPLSAGLPGAQLLLAEPVFAEDDLLLCSLLPRLCVNRNNRLGLPGLLPLPSAAAKCRE